MLRHPILLAFDERRLRAQLAESAKRAKIASYMIPFGADRHVLIVPKSDYQRVLRHTTMVIEYVEKKIRAAPADSDKLKLWNAEVLLGYSKTYRREDWRAFLLTWAFRTKPAEAFETGEDLATAFFRLAVGLRDERTIRVLAADLRGKVAPQDSRQELIEAAFELQSERDTDELIRDYAPRVVLLAATLFPVGSLPIVIGAAMTAITGFLECMQLLEDAEQDGDITEAEGQQAWWALLGILPFRFVQLGLFAAGIGAVGAALLRALRDGLGQLETWLERFDAARDHGWNSYVEFQGEGIVLPKYLLEEQW